MKISVAICIYNDFDFIEECVNRVYDLADEIVILDGPYDYCKPMLKYFDLYYEGLPQALRAIAGRSKVRYEFGTFENEKAKRIALYEMCKHNVVMLLDSDELIVNFDREELERFWRSDRKVACSSFSNLVRANRMINERTSKFIFFKRQEITAGQHLNYTWLVGVDQEKPNADLMYQAPVMEMAHLTLMRSPYFNVVKYCFYTRLYYYSRAMYDQLDKLFGRPFEALTAKGLSQQEIKDIFRRSLPALINFPTEAPLVATSLPTIDARFDNVADIGFLTHDQRVRVLDSVESFHYLDIPGHLLAGDELHVSFLTHEIESIEIELIVHDNAARTKVPVRLEFPRTGEVHGSCALPSDAAGLFGTLIKFKAKCTDRDGVGTIAQFIIKRRFATYGNCQTESLRDFLLSSNAFRRQYIFEETPGRLVHIMTEQDVHEFHKRLYLVDHLVAQPIGDDFGGNRNGLYGTAGIMRRIRPDAQVLMIPNMFFTGYAPDAYCVTYRKKFLQSPMPIHDVNFIYSYLRHTGERDLVSADYVKKLTEPDFYDPKFIRGHVDKNIAELETREADSREKFKGANVRFFSYSKFVAAWYDKTLLHYSDAHPTEFVFDKVARGILNHLGLENDLRPVVVHEKGALPFYRSIDVALGIDASATPIFLNDREVTFDEYFSQYCEEYDGIGTRELFGYVAGNVTKVVVTNHKTGTMLMAGILREYCARYGLRYMDLSDHLAANNARLGINVDTVDPALDFQSYDFIFVPHAQHFEILVDAVPNLRYRAVHLTRNPYEIIMSGVRFHQITDEQWCNKKLFVADARGPCGFRRIAEYDVGEDGEVGDHSYREIMNRLPDDEKIEFEIRNHTSTFSTILYIESFLKRFQGDGNITSVRLEDIATEECVKYVFEFLSLNEDFLDSYRSKVRSRTWLGGHVTNVDGKDTHQGAFNDRLYDLFVNQFGASMLHDLGYASSSPPPPYFADPGRPADANRRPMPGANGLSIVAARRNADELYAQGDKLLAQEALEAAKEAFEESLTFSMRISTLGRLGDICARLQHHEEAIAYYERIGTLTKELPAWAYIGLANCYEALRQTDPAISNLRLALNLMPELEALRERLERLEAAV